MELPQDLKNYSAEDDGLGSFRLISPDAAIVFLCCGLVLGFLAGAY
jgi:hypothetical protein